MISHAHKFIFIHIPKTGGTSVEEALLDESCECTKDLWDPRIKTTPLNHLTLNEMIEHDFVDVKTAASYFKFCFVRNPWARAVSEVNSRHVRYKGDTVQEQLRTINAISSYGNHIRPQVDFIDNRFDLEMDYIGRYETLVSDFQTVCERLDMELPVALPHRNASFGGDYRQYYDDELQEMIACKYREDIVRFDYRFSDI
ncbi:MAG: sulfotransferase family 2 domain-containing protein [Pseudomonadota bacterium]